jgi:uncharacterized tellurite resistance protein B-like protein
MRTYPTNSPQAAARIVALTLVADGHVSSTELAVLERVGAYRQLGITVAEMQTVLQDFCEDLLAGHRSTWTDACHIEPRTLAQLMAEIDDPALRMSVLRLCVAVAEADDHVADGESIVLVAAVENWGLHRQMLEERSVPEELRP